MGKRSLIFQPFVILAKISAKRKHAPAKCFLCLIFTFPSFEGAILSRGRCIHPYPVHVDGLIFDNSVFSVASAGFLGAAFRLLIP